MSATNGTPLGEKQPPPLKITVRRATVDDAAQIAHLGIFTFSQTFGHSVPPHELQAYLDEAYTPEAVTGDIVNPHKDMIVATTPQAGPSGPAESILGFALLTRGTMDPCITHLVQPVEFQKIYIHPNYQGYGVGKLLAAEIDKMAREQGFRHIWLGVWEENVKARTVYERLGFKRVGEHDFLVGSVAQTDWIMAKAL